MDRRAVSELGTPDLAIAGFQVWVHGYQYPDVVDVWDANWLRISAHCGASGASVWVGGAILETAGFLSLARGAARMHASLSGDAVLDSHEPNIMVRIATADRTGHVTVVVELTPDHLTQQHRFEFAIDQSYLPAVVAQCHRVLERYPVRDAASLSSRDSV